MTVSRSDTDRVRRIESSIRQIGAVLFEFGPLDASNDRRLESGLPCGVITRRPGRRRDSVTVRPTRWRNSCRNRIPTVVMKPPLRVGSTFPRERSRRIGPSVIRVRPPVGRTARRRRTRPVRTANWTASSRLLVVFLDDLGIAHRALEAVEAVDPLRDEAVLEVLGDGHVEFLAVDDERARLRGVAQRGV